MKSSIVYINIHTTLFQLHPAAESAATAWQKLKRHWKSSEFTRESVTAIINETVICAIKKGNVYLFFSGFETVRLIQQHNIKKVAIRLYEKISDDDIRRYSASYLALIKLYSLSHKTGLASLQQAASAYLPAEVTIAHFGSPLHQVKTAATTLGLTHKPMRTQLKNLKGEK